MSLPYKILKKFFPKIAKETRKTYERYQISLADVDWSRTLAYSFGWGGVYINLKEREPEGIVDVEQYDDLLRQIAQKLQNFVDPDSNECVVDRIFRKEDPLVWRRI